MAHWMTFGGKNGIGRRKQDLPFFLPFSRLTHSASFLYDGMKLFYVAVWWFNSFLSFWYYTNTEDEEKGENDGDDNGLNDADVHMWLWRGVGSWNVLTKNSIFSISLHSIIFMSIMVNVIILIFSVISFVLSSNSGSNSNSSVNRNSDRYI